MPVAPTAPASQRGKGHLHHQVASVPAGLPAAVHHKKEVNSPLGAQNAVRPMPGPPQQGKSFAGHGSLPVAPRHPSGMATVKTAARKKTAMRHRKRASGHRAVRYHLMEAINEAIFRKLEATLKSSSHTSKAFALKKPDEGIELEWKVDEVEPGSYASLKSGSCVKATDGSHKCVYKRDGSKISALFNLTMGRPLDNQVRSHSHIDVRVGTLREKVDVWCTVCGESCTFKLMGMSRTIPAARCPIPAGPKLFDLPIGQFGGVDLPSSVVTSIRTTIFRDKRIIVRYSFTVRT